MKVNIKLVVLSLLLLLFASDSYGRRGSQPVQLKRISDRLFEVLGGRGARGGAYIGDNGVLLIDAKMDSESAEQVIGKVGQITDKPVRYVVNTHSDGDHVVGNRFFADTVTFIAHENCRKEFFHTRRDGSASEWAKPELAPFVPSVTFRDKMVIHLGSKKVELWYFGVGHTTGDIVVYFPEEKTAFLGDQIFIARPQLIHSYKGGNSFEHVKTLAKMLQTIEAEKFCSGHSDMTDRDGISKHIDRMRKLQEKVKALIAEGKSVDAIKTEFESNETRLIETIYNETTKGFR
ncbi:MAG: MBL fold metallo-hydrolase [Phycisphaerales bacterium]|nr:MAG: MBL fold metallo-hydrolase [Phycisphaerales bacterium]